MAHSEDHIASIHALSCVSTSWLDKVKLSWEANDAIKELISELQKSHSYKGYA